MTFTLPEPITPIGFIAGDGGFNPLSLQLGDLHRSDGRVKVDGLGELILLSSYSYLGLLGHPDIDRAAKLAVDESGTGVHGVRILAGTLSKHVELEGHLARFHRCDATITYSSGYVANLSTIAGLVGPGDAVFSDVLNHASIHDGCKLSGAEVIPFAHNNPADLNRKLNRSAAGRKLVVIDAVYSMDGNIVRLPEILEAAEQHGALLMIDEAHSLGVIGATGKGLLEHFGIEPRRTIIKMGTLSKAIPSIGGYVAASADIVELLRHRARGYIFSSALPAPCAAAANAALEVIERETWRVERLQRNAALFRRLLNERGVNTLRSETAVIPALCGESRAAIAASRACIARGVLALPVTSPAVQHHMARLRLIPMASHSEADLRTCADIVGEVIRAVTCATAAG